MASCFSAQELLEAEPQALNPAGLQLVDGSIGQFGRGARRDGDLEAESVGIVNEFINIFAAGRVTAGQDQVGQGIAEVDELLQETPALFGVELQRIGVRHGLGAAVFAGEAAGLRSSPGRPAWDFWKNRISEDHEPCGPCVE